MSCYLGRHSWDARFGHPDDPIHTPEGHRCRATCTRCGTSATIYMSDVHCCVCHLPGWDYGDPIPKSHLEKSQIGSHQAGQGHAATRTCRNCHQVTASELIRRKDCPRCYLPAAPEITRPAEGAVLRKEPLAVECTTVDGATQYLLELFDQTAGEMVAGFPVDAHSNWYTIPADKLIEAHRYQLKAGVKSDLDGPRWTSPRTVTLEAPLLIEGIAVSLRWQEDGKLTAQVQWTTDRPATSWATVNDQRYGNDRLVPLHLVEVPDLLAACTALVESSTSSGATSFSFVEIRMPSRTFQPRGASATISSSSPVRV